MSDRDHLETLKDTVREIWVCVANIVNKSEKCSNMMFPVQEEFDKKDCKSWQAWSSWVESQNQNCVMLFHHLNCNEATGDFLELTPFCGESCIRVPRAHPLAACLQLLNETFEYVADQIKPAVQGTDFGKSRKKSQCKKRNFISTKNIMPVVAKCCQLLHALKFVECAVDNIISHGKSQDNPDPWDALAQIAHIINQLIEERAKSAQAPI